MSVAEKIRKWSSENPRAVGSLFLLSGGLLFYFSFLKPLRELESGAAEGTFYMKLALMGILLMLGAAILLVLGKRSVPFMMTRREDMSKKQIYIIAAVAIVITVLFLYLSNSYLESKGYR